MKYIILGFLALAACSTTQTTNKSETRSHLAVQSSPEDRQIYEATGKDFVVATQGRAATEAVKKIKSLGGNIIDAAVAASFVISVERPQSTGIGGGGFLLHRDAKTGQVSAIDFRERAPLRATKDMYLDSKGEVIPGKSVDGVFSVGIPGLVAGLLEIHQKLGKLSRAQVMEPAIALAENGFTVYKHLAIALEDRKELLARYPSTAKIFLRADGAPLKPGDQLVQKDLAKTLRLISKKGAAVFYRGEIAQAIVKTSKAQKGILSAKDFAAYKVKWREPVRGNYKGYEVISMSPPSSGGTHVVQILNILEKDSLKNYGFGSPTAVHLEAAAMQQAFADRAAFMGDPDFNKGIPLKGLLSKNYAHSIRERVDLARAKPSDEIRAGSPQGYESTETTHFSMMDAEGNVVVSTQTINGWMGSGVVADGTGILLNNEMDDFSAKPGASNLYGAVGGAPNSVAPLKTPLSSMSPTMVLKDATPILALGSPGGTRIITCVAQTVLNYLDFGLPLYDAIASVRIHHQWKPDLLNIESPGFGEATTLTLKEKGYKVEVGEVPCIVNAVAREGETLRGVADPRDLGSAWAE